MNLFNMLNDKKKDYAFDKIIGKYRSLKNPNYTITKKRFKSLH